MSQKKRNQRVAELCKKAGWYSKLVVGTDGVTYRAFSPQVKDRIMFAQHDKTVFYKVPTGSLPKRLVSI